VYYSDNPHRDFDRHDKEQNDWLERCPVCAFCHQPIQDEELFDFGGTLYHVSCAEEEFKKSTEDYME